MANGHNLFVSFDLVHPAENLDRLGKAIVLLGIPVKISPTLWYVDSLPGPQEAEALLRAACNPGDTLIVIDASSAISRNLQPASGEMLQTLWNANPPPDAPPAGAAAQLAWMEKLFSTLPERRAS